MSKIKLKNPKLRVIFCSNCKTRCQFRGYRGKGDFLIFGCKSDIKKCDYQIEIKAAPEEKTFLQNYDKEMLRSSSAVHTLFHTFCKKFEKTVKTGKFTTWGKKKIKLTRTEWRWKGYELMKRVREYTKKHPEILVTGVDDAAYSNSDLVFIPHYDTIGKSYHGTTILYIPQCTGENPISFFLYPGHARELLNTMAILGRTYKGAIKKE